MEQLKKSIRIKIELAWLVWLVDWLVETDSVSSQSTLFVMASCRRLIKDEKPEINAILSQASEGMTITSGDTIHFLVTKKKGPNYLQYCNEVVLPHNPKETLHLYSSHTNDLYQKVNLSLASDSGSLREHGPYISQLRASILQQPLLTDSRLYRGVELSKKEITEMETLKNFFIPSFTSTSEDITKIYDKNSVLVIQTVFMSKYGCTMTADFSDYSASESEVLLACYSAFHLERIEIVNGKKYLSLFLDESSSSSNYL